MNTPSTRPSPAPTAWRSFWIASAAVFLVLLDTTAMVAAYAPLRAHFSGVSPAGLSWTLNAYTVLYAALLMPAGRLADLLGRKRLFLHGRRRATASRSAARWRRRPSPTARCSRCFR